VEHEKDVRAAAAVTSGRGNAVVGRTLYPVVTRRLTPPAAASTQDAAWIEANPEEWDALISVWWDKPPCEDPR
jgi:hypothetical protein